MLIDFYVGFNFCLKLMTPLSIINSELKFVHCWSLKNNTVTFSFSSQQDLISDEDCRTGRMPIDMFLETQFWIRLLKNQIFNCYLMAIHVTFNRIWSLLHSKISNSIKTNTSFRFREVRKACSRSTIIFGGEKHSSTMTINALIWWTWPLHVDENELHVIFQA